jgi:chemotaxis receptor (MCP) glutamine deamidase CheD
MRLMRACAQVLRVSATGISYFSGFRHRVPLGNGDAQAVPAERLQFTVGEGPCVTAHVEDRAVLATAHTMAPRSTKSAGPSPSQN